jgi:hypothetical protein
VAVDVVVGVAVAVGVGVCVGVDVGLVGVIVGDGLGVAVGEAGGRVGCSVAAGVADAGSSTRVLVCAGFDGTAVGSEREQAASTIVTTISAPRKVQMRAVRRVVAG